MKILILIIATLFLMWAIVLTLNVTVYLIRLSDYLKVKRNVTNPDYLDIIRPNFRVIDAYWVGICWALFYLCHYL